VYHDSAAFSIVPPHGKKIHVDFNGGRLTADAGAVLLQQIDQKLKLTEQIKVKELQAKE
jgi:hypothetical protein